VTTNVADSARAHSSNVGEAGCIIMSLVRTSPADVYVELVREIHTHFSSES
jgi:hypothetical protein